ncbi:MAG: hypothetical protein SLAVMIC_00808 [uncultured marine phage]|uniref:Uncharacterized protein n=1 Tax=uncultured marine phage TaxID=707152 RepID=A0A8D9FQJ1_9VIRU|nr:MAG: hypothetical protein SLAVMIC_00808 [uncultured marine phage]
MNVIGIDPSLVSTAMSINGEYLFNYTKEKYAHNKSGLNKWYKMCEQYVKYRWINYDQNDNFTDSEINKLNDFNILSDMVIEDIKKHIKPGEPIKIGIEGYSYSSAAGPLIDLVTYGTLLRDKLLKLTNDVTIFPPSTLKLESAKLTYPMVMEKKKQTWRNSAGTSGGKFSKHEMYLALTENESLEDDWTKFLRQIKGDVFGSKVIKKPMEDCNDAFLIYQVLKNRS